MRIVIGRLHGTLILSALAMWLGAPKAWCEGGRLLQPMSISRDSTVSPNIVRHRCLTPEGNDERLFGNIAQGWRLPSSAAAGNFDTTIHCLVLRYNFQYETPDNPITTGRGHMDLSRPLDTLTDEQYIARVGHLIDPPPHDSLYYDAHMRALNRYWETVSGGKIHLTWDIYPPYRDSIYQLPYSMSHYGRCDFSQVVAGLENFFVDCIKTADTTDPEIDFSQYQAFFLFHAGSDAQNDIGFPVTCEDLYSGYIKFGDTVWVDDNTHTVRQALMMPETAVQDNRATALNAVMAHEFGHQLGLLDLYSTENFYTQLGDFSLMDNNGFGTGIDFGWPIGKVFGAIPVLPDAWSRAFLGTDEADDIRADTVDVRLTAAEMTTDPGLRIARLPISENEYYLIENRLEELDHHTTYVLADSVTSVIQGPVDSTRAFTGEYDFLMPGSGALIYHVDEGVAGLDYDGNGVDNFHDNKLQWYRDERKFISLVEADGIVHFGGNYYSGYGDQGDCFRDDQAHEFTPLTNPPTIDNAGGQTHFYVENIGRPEIPGGHDDKIVRFDFQIDNRAHGFPVRAGAPLLALAPIADDLDGDGTPEIIMAAGRYLSVITSTGENFIRTKGDCPSCPEVYDLDSSSSINHGGTTNPPAVHPVPVFALAPSVIQGVDTVSLFFTAAPVTGRVTTSVTDTTKLVAAGYPHPGLPGTGVVALYLPRDTDNNARADTLATMQTIGFPAALSFGDSVLYALTASGSEFRLYHWAVAEGSKISGVLPSRDVYSGICRLGPGLILLASDTGSVDAADSSWIYYVTRVGSNSYLSVFSFSFQGLYLWGPIAVDMNLDGKKEIAAFTPDGDAVLITVDLAGGTPSFSVLNARKTDRLVVTPPSAGDVDLDGYPEIVVGGRNEVLAFNQDLIFKTDFPLEVDDRFTNADIIAAPLIADLVSGGRPELLFPSDRGNFYSYDERLSYGFPLSSGGQRQYISATPAVRFYDNTGGKVGWLGGDGWFYAWDADVDTTTDFWPMNGGDPSGSFAFDESKLPATSPATTAFDESRFYNYPNPVRDGLTTIRYYLGADANSVRLNIYDLSGRRIARLDGTGRGNTDNEVSWDCSGITSGVYRCVIEVNFPGNTETAFKDIAVIR